MSDIVKEMLLKASNTAEQRAGSHELAKMSMKSIMIYALAHNPDIIEHFGGKNDRTLSDLNNIADMVTVSLARILEDDLLYVAQALSNEMIQKLGASVVKPDDKDVP